MYIRNSDGSKSPVVLNVEEPIIVEKFNHPRPPQSPPKEKPEGSNKLMLYITLAIGLCVVAGSGYLLYRNVKKEKKAHIGYQIA